MSGLKFEFEPAYPAGDRIIGHTMTDMDGNPFDMDKVYSVALNNYLAQGKDGFQVLLDPSIEKCNYTEEYETDIRDILSYFLKTF